MHSGHVTNSITRTSDYNIYVKLPRRGGYLIVHGYTGAVDMVGDNVVSFLKECATLRRDHNASKPRPPSETIDALRARGYITSKTPHEEREFVSRLAQRLHAASCRRSSFLFFVTYNCDFDCPYCFQRDLRRSDYSRPKTSISTDLVDNAYRAMTEINPERSLHGNRIMLTGGEPLLPENYDIVSHIIGKGSARGYTFGAVTNGYSLDYFAGFLGPGMIGALQVTLDGSRDRHNALRRRKDGSPTFDRIVRNIGLALASGVTVSLRINMSGNPAEDLVRLDREIAGLGWVSTGRFSAYIANVRCRTNRGHAASDNPTLETRDDTHSENIADTQKELRHINGFDPELRGRIRKMLVRGNGFPFRVDFCGATNGMMIFDPFGEIYPCLETVGMCGCGVGTYGGKVYIDREKIEGYWRRSLCDSGCLDCRYLFICGRGCPVGSIICDGGGRPEMCREFPARFNRMVIDEFGRLSNQCF